MEWLEDMIINFFLKYYFKGIPNLGTGRPQFTKQLRMVSSDFQKIGDGGPQFFVTPAPVENERSSPNCGNDDDDDGKTEIIAESFGSDNTCDLNNERGTPAQDQSTKNSSLVEFCIKFLV